MTMGCPPGGSGVPGLVQGRAWPLVTTAGQLQCQSQQIIGIPIPAPV